MSDWKRQEVVTWENRLQRSYTTEQVLAVVNDFIATWSPPELAALPEPLRPGRMRGSDDVGLYAFKLASRRDLGANSHILLRMSTFFTAASQRLSQIYAIAAREAQARANEDAGG